ncbi:MAG: thermonuclease family protein [Pseudomonas sp.]
MALSGSRKALLWGAFFIVWLVARPVFSASCSMPGVGKLVVSKQVIDGDTLDLVDGRRVRLVGINAPEIGRNGRPSEPYAQAARKALASLVKGGELRLLVGEEPRDRYGRTLGHLFDGSGANLEANLLREGLGFAVALPPNLRLLDCHLQQEQQARQQRLGVWKANPARRASQVDSGGFHLLRGRIETISRTGRHIWIDLDGSVALRLPRGLIAADELSAWKGRKIEARGWVVDRGRVRRGQKR